MKLNTSQYENSEYLCLPDNGPVTFEVKGCSVAMEKHTEGKRVENAIHTLDQMYLTFSELSLSRNMFLLQTLLLWSQFLFLAFGFVFSVIFYGAYLPTSYSQCYFSLFYLSLRDTLLTISLS